MEENNEASAKPKLRLAKKLAAPADEGRQPEEPPAPTSGPEGPPALKVPQPEEAAGPAAKADPGDPFAAIRKKERIPAPEPALSEPEAKPPAGPPSLGLQPPTAQAGHAPQLEQPEPAAAAAPAPTPTPTPAAQEELPPPFPPPPPAAPVTSGTEATAPSGSKGLLMSLLFVGALFLVLGGSAAGIWFVLREPAPQAEAAPPPEPDFIPGPITPEATSATASADELPVETSDQPGPIARTKQAIAALEALALPGDVAEQAGGPAEAGAFPGETAPAAAPIENAAMTAHKEAVTQYLGGIFIGAVGGASDNPRAMIDGESYARGDVVNPALGLEFADAKKGTLFFRDSYGIVYVKRF